MTRWGLVLAAAIASLLSLAGGASAAEVPAGPRLAIVKWEAPGSATELFTAGPLGEASQTLYARGPERVPSPYPFDVPSWSPDGAAVVFSAVTGQVRREHGLGPRMKLFRIPATGGVPEPLAGTDGGFSPVFAPDGHRLAFAKSRERWRENDRGGADSVFRSTSVWMIDLADGGAPRQLTPWRHGLEQAPSSFSPDGSTLAITRMAGDRPPDVVGLRFDGSPPAVLVRNALGLVYSPDGAWQAFLRGPFKRIVKRRRLRNGSSVSVIWVRLTDLYVRSADGQVLRQLTSTPRASELAPSWDPSGQRLVYAEFEFLRSEAAAFGFGNAVRAVNADGTCPMTVLRDRRSVHYGAVWQPGVGRAAGPIAC